MQPKFYYNMQTAYFISGYDKAILDKYLYKLKAPAKAAGIDVLVPLYDVCRIYSPDMSVKIDGAAAIAAMNGRTVSLQAGNKQILINGNKFVLRNAPELIDGILYVPVADFMQFGFGKYVKSTGDISPEFLSRESPQALPGEWPMEYTVVAVGSKNDVHIDGMFLRYVNVMKRGKKCGEQYKTYWMEEPKKVVPYILYIPYKYNPDIPSKLLVFLHGGTIDMGEKYAFHFSRNTIQPVCEKYNYILLCANACTLLNMYGNSNTADGTTFTEEEKALRLLGDKSVMQAIAEVESEYNIDKSHVYLMGNSMGGGGTLHLPTVHPGVFRAIAPGAASIRITILDDIEKLRGTPIFLIGGTEDDFGFDNVEYTYETLKQAGLDIEFCVVGGGLHIDAWVSVLDETFRFFEKHS